MERSALEAYIAETYNAQADHPWAKYPRDEVFRHSNSGKWFALVMEVPKARLGLAEDGNLDVVNLKCDPIVIGSLRGRPGFFPAYHMNKDSWITVALDGSVDPDEVKALLDMSFELTRVKVKKRRATEQG